LGQSEYLDQEIVGSYIHYPRGGEELSAGNCGSGTGIGVAAGAGRTTGVCAVGAAFSGLGRVIA
jgi:hypothetical protein